jgi:hypothetical protein
LIYAGSITGAVLAADDENQFPARYRSPVTQAWRDSIKANEQIRKANDQS